MTPSLPLSRYSSFRSLDRVYLKTPQRCPILPERHICRVAFACIPSSGVQRSCALHLYFSGEWSSIFDFSDTPWPGVHTGGVGVGVPVVHYHMDDACNTSIHRKRGKSRAGQRAKVRLSAGPDGTPAPAVQHRRQRSEKPTSGGKKKQKKLELPLAFRPVFWYTISAAWRGRLKRPRCGPALTASEYREKDEKYVRNHRYRR